MREGFQKLASLDDTIVALSTPIGKAGLGIVRMSGPRAADIAEKFLDPKVKLEHRRANVGKWRDEIGPVDEVVATLFKGPNSYTGEDLVEVTAHGNPHILARLVEMCSGAGAREAKPGEFTLRSVANGKMDLIQAEAVRDFIDAQTERQARNAIRQIEGQVSKRIRPLQDSLIGVIARLEAGIDFAEDDVDIPDARAVCALIEPLIEEFTRLQHTFGYGQLLTGGLRLTIAGRPNVGKSSLFNRLLSADRAIVTEVPGTTRDVLTETVNLDGIPLRCADTAGIRSTADRVERIGVERSFDAISEADLVLVILDGSQVLHDDDRQVLSATEGLRRLIAINKSDLRRELSTPSVCGRTLAVSAKTGEGLVELTQAIRESLAARPPDRGDECVLTSARQNEVLGRARAALKKGRNALADSTPHEMALLDLYEALAALNELTGETTNEDILDCIFSTFCIGK